MKCFNAHRCQLSNLEGVEHDEDVVVDFVFSLVHSQDSKQPSQHNRQHYHNGCHQASSEIIPTIGAYSK